MNLTKLFEMQKELDERINREHPPEPGEDRLAKKILALQVELGECANEWRGFKFWSKNQKPTTERDLNCDCPTCEGCQEPGNPLLEEYVDCLHFILSIGLDIEFEVQDLVWHYITLDVTERLIDVFHQVSTFAWDADHYEYQELFAKFLSLAEPFGFTLDEVESAYLSKNQVNHERQVNGY